MKDLSNEYSIQYPLSISWYLTSKCNLNCEFCFFSDNFDVELTSNEWTDIVENIKMLKPFSLNLIGGEIFHLDDFFILLDLLIDCNFKTNLATNGVLLDEVKIKKLSNYDIGEIQISLDGSCEDVNDLIRGDGTFNKIVYAIKQLLYEGFKVSIATLICKKNIEDIINIIKFADELLVDQISFNLFIPNGRGIHVNEQYKVEQKELELIINKMIELKSSENLRININIPIYGNYNEIMKSSEIRSDKQNLRHITSYGCQAGRKKFVILPNGDIVACENLQNDIEGNTIKNSLYELWFSDQSFIKWRYPKPLKGKCKSCQVFDKCLGGCRANAVLYKNDFYAEDPLCYLNSY